MYDCVKASTTLCKPTSIVIEWEPMEKVNSYKYLGVTLTSDLTWSHHIRNITAKSRRLVGLLYRQFYKWSSPATLSRLYISLVRSHLEHAVSAWNLYLAKDINSLECVQRFTLKVCLKQWQLLNQSCLPDLSTRHKHLSLCYLYNIVNGIHVYPNLPLVPYLTHLCTCSETHILTCNLVLTLIIFSIPFSHM